MAEIEVREAHHKGRGVFTLEPLREGDVVREFKIKREVTADAPLQPTDGERPEHAFLSDRRYWLVGPPDCYFNHSCDANVYNRCSDAGIHVVARRNVDADAELTIDYLINNEGGDSWECHCGADRCRGKTGHSFFTLPEEIQREYYPLLAPWFLERYADRLLRTMS